MEGTAMAGCQHIIDRAVAQGAAPFIVAMAGNASGVTWSGAAGEAAEGRKAAEDTVFRIFSMSKAVGATMAMILVDRGQLSLDTPVADILPEFGDLQVLEGFDGDRPVLRAPKTRCTVRHLATHTSGLVYEFWSPALARYLKVTGHPTVMSGLERALNYPLAFDPGTQWGYGIGIDWLGKLVSAVDGRSIERFATEEIFAPLAMTDTSFRPDEDQKSRLAAGFARGTDGFRRSGLNPPAEPEFHGLGHCLYSTAPDYLRFLRLYLGGGSVEGVRILSREAADTALANQSGDLDIGSMVSVDPRFSADVDLFPGLAKSHAVLALRVEEDVPGGLRSAGSLGWSGAFNTHFWIDPARDVAGVFMTQLLPFADARFMRALADFEKAVQAGSRG
jgi:methyl acetate hydrolase